MEFALCISPYTWLQTGPNVTLDLFSEYGIAYSLFILPSNSVGIGLCSEYGTKGIFIYFMNHILLYQSV